MQLAVSFVSHRMLWVLGVQLLIWIPGDGFDAWLSMMLHAVTLQIAVLNARVDLLDPLKSL